MSMPQSEAPRRSSHSVSSRSTAPRVFRYVLKHDHGFAPCFDDGVCTLGCCKPNIRRSAVVGDWILGFAPRKKGNARLLFVMQVGEVLGFDESNRFAAGVHEAEARRQRGDKDSPVRQGVDATCRIGSAMGHALFIAQAAPVPGEQETSTLGVVDRAGREQRLGVAGPRDTCKSSWRRRRVVASALPRP